MFRRIDISTVFHIMQFKRLKINELVIYADNTMHLLTLYRAFVAAGAAYMTH